jgi:dTDP-glucose 4,6-dehydratase
MSKTLLVTGGCGFIGHHVVEHYIKNTDYNIVVLDKLTYASNGFDRLRDINVFDDKRVKIFTCDITNDIADYLLSEIGDVNFIIHLGAETHVDNSIKDPQAFVLANVIGSVKMLEYARKLPHLEKFIYFSTDEVFGPAPQGTFFEEWSRYNSTNPYSATKAAGEEISLAYANTYKVPVIITHCMNVFGERQHIEKFIPSTIKKILEGDEVIIHSDTLCSQAGSRFYIHARNVADAVDFVIRNGVVRDKYNIVGEIEIDNLLMASMIAQRLGKVLLYKMVDFHSSRPGHDLRYALNGDKMRSMGWGLPLSFKDSLDKTIDWYINNPKWLGGVNE